MLKFEALAEIGDTIKAFDFEPMTDRPDRFVVGTVVAKGMTDYGYAAYTIDVTEDSVYTDPRARTEVIVPFQVSFMEYDERVQLVQTA